VGNQLDDYVILEEDFIVLSKFLTVSQADLNRVEKFDIMRLVPPDTGGVPEPSVGEDEPGSRPPVDSYDRILKQMYAEFYNVAGGKQLNIDQVMKVAREVKRYALTRMEPALSKVARGCNQLRLVKHSIHVGILTAIGASQLLDSEEEVVDCVAGALLHDVGIFRISGSVGLDEIREHAVGGYTYLLKLSISNPLIVTPALQHHEHADGSGYPKSVDHREMTISSKLVALADSWDSQIGLIKYGNDISIHYSKEEFSNWKPEHFDTSLFTIFEQIVSRFAQQGGRVRLNDGRSAVVTKTSMRFPFNPVVRIEGEEGDAVDIDLRKEKDLWIEK
jgi:HD-GYP domain-containing protein (c-di-GMP phosphodiesterase class II)